MSDVEESIEKTSVRSTPRELADQIHSKVSDLSSGPVQLTGHRRLIAEQIRYRVEVLHEEVIEANRRAEELGLQLMDLDSKLSIAMESEGAKERLRADRLERELEISREARRIVEAALRETFDHLEKSVIRPATATSERGKLFDRVRDLLDAPNPEVAP